LVGACPVLRVLNLNDCRVGTQGAVDLAAVLTSNLTLHELHVASNQINDRGMAALVKALKGNQALHTFNFSDNGLSADGAKLLGDMLEKNPHVTTLALGFNKFGDLGINHLYHGIKCNTTYDPPRVCDAVCAVVRVRSDVDSLRRRQIAASQFVRHGVHGQGR
jgi:hypothetical protein